MGLRCTEGYPVRDVKSQHVVIQDPSASENITLYYTPNAITITKLEADVSGLASSPSVTWSVRHDTIRAAVGTEVVTGGTTTTDTSSGHTMFGFVGETEVTSFDSPHIPAGSFLWVTTSAVSGNTSAIAITVYFQED